MVIVPYAYCLLLKETPSSRRNQRLKQVAEAIAAAEEQLETAKKEAEAAESTAESTGVKPVKLRKFYQY